MSAGGVSDSPELFGLNFVLGSVGPNPLYCGSAIFNLGRKLMLRSETVVDRKANKPNLRQGLGIASQLLAVSHPPGAAVDDQNGRRWPTLLWQIRIKQQISIGDLRIDNVVSDFIFEFGWLLRGQGERQRDDSRRQHGRWSFMVFSIVVCRRELLWHSLSQAIPLWSTQRSNLHATDRHPHSTSFY